MCCYRDHEDGALNIYNSENVFINNCTFHNNTSSSYFTRKPYQRNAGGLSIGYNSQLTKLDDVDIVVTNCRFTNNRAAPPSALILPPTKFLTHKIFSGRGGGLSIPVNLATSSLNCVVNNSVFINNYAVSFGGAYVLYFCWWICFKAKLFG